MLKKRFYYLTGNRIECAKYPRCRCLSSANVKIVDLCIKCSYNVLIFAFWYRQAYFYWLYVCLQICEVYQNLFHLEIFTNPVINNSYNGKQQNFPIFHMSGKNKNMSKKLKMNKSYRNLFLYFI